MGTSRYSNRKIIINNNSLYQQKMLDKAVMNFTQYDTAKLYYISSEDIRDLERITHIWKQGDSFEKISNKYYDDPNYWWVIAYFNQTPTEQHIVVGQSIYVPLPLYEILSLIE